MLHFFPGWCAHAQKTKLLSRLDAAIEFHFAILTMAFSSLWQRFQRYFLEYRDLGFSLDVSRMKFPDDLFEKMRPQIERAFAAMRELEAGAIANPTENRMVGHYWLRNPALAPTPEIRSEIEETIRRIKAFAEDVHAEEITAKNGRRFEHVLHIGIGGSALGPQFASAAMLLALMWYYAGNGRARRTWSFFPRKIGWRCSRNNLQQLVMESLGKEKNLADEIVHQGIAVYGNKDSTDQHSYVQQLRDGVLNFFVTFVEVRNDRSGARFEVEDGITSGDYFHGFLRG